MSKQKVDFKKLKEIEKQMKIAKKTVINVGLPGDVGFYKNGTSILEVGATHEFGSPEKKIPQRSFLRFTFKRDEDKMDNIISKGFKNVLNGKEKTIKVANKIGIFGSQLVQKTIESDGYGTWKPLNSLTIARKGDSKKLVDTGRLIQSITSWVTVK